MVRNEKRSHHGPDSASPHLGTRELPSENRILDTAQNFPGPAAQICTSRSTRVPYRTADMGCGLQTLRLPLVFALHAKAWAARVVPGPRWHDGVHAHSIRCVGSAGCSVCLEYERHEAEASRNNRFKRLASSASARLYLKRCIVSESNR